MNINEIAEEIQVKIAGENCSKWPDWLTSVGHNEKDTIFIYLVENNEEAAKTLEQYGSKYKGFNIEIECIGRVSSL